MIHNFEFYFDGVRVKEPNNFEDFEEVFMREETKRHVYYDYPISLEFVGDGYDYLDAVYKVSYDSQTELKIVEVTNTGKELVFEAKIKTSNVTFDLVRQIAICEIDDVSYQAYIFSNYSVESGCGVSVTKNGVGITPIESIGLTVFDPILGTDLPDPRRAYDVKDVMQMLIQYISDDTITFESDWYDSLPNDERLCILSGLELRTFTGRTSPILSLEDMFNELWRKYNLYLIVENPITSPIVRLEKESYLYGDSEVEILLTGTLDRSIDFERLYSTIDLGSDKFIQERGTEFLFPYLRLYAFAEETFNVTGVINVDNKLDLKSQFIIDTNVIQDILENDEDSYDEDIVIIQYDSDTNTATKGTYFDTISEDSRLYNEQLLNSNVADRFSYLGNLVLESGAVETSFLAEQNVPLQYIRDFTNAPETLTVVPEQVWQFQDDFTPPNHDIGDDYDASTGIFTANVDGEYVFRSRFFIFTYGNASNPPGAGTAGFDIGIDLWVSVNADTETKPFDYQFTHYHFDGSTTTYTQDIEDTFTIPIGCWKTEVSITQTRTMVDGDEAAVRVRIEATREIDDTITFGTAESTFELIANPLAGGVYATKSPDDYYVGIYTSQGVPVERGKWNIIRENVDSKVILSAPDGYKRISYGKKISRNFVTGRTEIETVFNRNQPII